MNKCRQSVNVAEMVVAQLVDFVLSKLQGFKSHFACLVGGGVRRLEEKL